MNPVDCAIAVDESNKMNTLWNPKDLVIVKASA
jgi:hypothetical protein